MVETTEPRKREIEHIAAVLHVAFTSPGSLGGLFLRPDYAERLYDAGLRSTSRDSEHVKMFDSLIPYCGVHHEPWPCTRSTSRDSEVRHEHSPAKCADCRALAYNPGLDEALNSGDGTYKP